MTGPVASWPLSQWTDAGQIVCAISDRNKAGDAAGVDPPRWYGQLRDDGRREDAVMFLAHAMPRYECVVWGAQALLAMNVVRRDDPLFVAVLRWIDDPGDATRRAAARQVEALDTDDPRWALAQAVFFSGGSIAPEGLAAVQPDAHVCARMVGGALLFGAREAKDRDKALDMALAMGEDTLGNARA